MKHKKNIVVHNYYTVLNQGNFMFEHDDAPGIGEGLLKPFKVLKEKAAGLGCSVGTRDFFPKEEKIDAFFFLDLPKKNDPVFIEAQKSGQPLYLVLMESPIIRPMNYQKENHAPFKKVFTWDSFLVDQQKYIKICIPQNPSPRAQAMDGKPRKLATLIASNKKSKAEGELYSQRAAAIEFFEQHGPEHFDLYGNGWDRDVYSGAWKFLNLLNRLPWKMPLRLQRRYHVYRGTVASKLETLSRYKFSICFENFSTARGYITEKIFDSFYAGCVPVYWGAPDIGDYVPANCFIDMRHFSSFADLFAHLHSMDEKAFLQYQHNIKAFLESAGYRVFSSDFFAQTLLDHLSSGAGDV